VFLAEPVPSFRKLQWFSTALERKIRLHLNVKLLHFNGKNTIITACTST